jgi:oxaloacetate decarboxylase gamma subunit
MDVGTSELLMEGVWLMVTGMTIVFAFLLLLVGMLFGMSRLAAWLQPAGSAPEPAAAPRPNPADAPGVADPRTAAVIAAALRYHRDHRGG